VLCALIIVYSTNSIALHDWVGHVGQLIDDNGDDGRPHQSTIADQCLTATAGHLLVADSRGYVCDRFALGLTSHRNCCVPGMDRWLLRCNSCAHYTNGGDTRHCCELYEFCVSCCMARHLNASDVDLDLDPGAQAAQSRRILPRSADHGPTNFSVFKWCALSCRSNSMSTPAPPNHGRVEAAAAATTGPLLLDPDDPTAHLHCLLPMPMSMPTTGGDRSLSATPTPSCSPSRSASVSPTTVPLDDWLEF